MCQVKGLLDKEEVLLAKNSGSLRGAHVVIGTPDAVAEAVSAPDPVPVLGSLKALAVDEADACLQVMLSCFFWVTDRGLDAECGLQSEWGGLFHCKPECAPVIVPEAACSIARLWAG